MHVVIIGAGALGRTYGVHLASAGVRTSYYVRPARLKETSAFVVVRLNGDKRRLTLEEPERVGVIPKDATLLVLALRREQLDEAIEDALAKGPAVPLVALTPLLPLSEARLASIVPGPCLMALPTVAARLERERVECFVPPFAKTTIESDGGKLDTVSELIAALNESGLPAKWQSGVRRSNPATTIAFFPLTVALSLAGSLDVLLRDEELWPLSLEATREARELASLIGPIEAPVKLALSCANRATFGAGLAAARTFAPRVTELLEAHFAQKLRAQHRVLGQEILALGRQYNVTLPKLADLLLRARRSDRRSGIDALVRTR